MKKHSLFLRTSSAIALVSVIGAAAYAAAPEAGSVIGNQAVATYLNDSGDTITVTSNKVETIVQQIAGVSMTSDNAEALAPGGKAFLPHIITNDGNGADSFLLSVAEQSAGALDLASLVFYPDADMDGVADSTTPITQSPTLGVGEQFGFIIEATAPSTAGGTEDLLVTSTSVLDGTILASNTDTLTISNGPIVELVKSMTVDPASGGNTAFVDAGDVVTITLSYSSTGLATANVYAVEDILDSRLTYVAGSARWSDAAAPLNDAAAGAPDETNGSGETIDYSYDGTETVGFEISEVKPGRRGSVTFQAVINSTADSGVIPNQATQSINGAAYPPSNTASVNVDSQYLVSIADTQINTDGSVNTSVVSATDDDATSNDTVAESSSAAQGGVVEFEFVISNRSNESDSYSLEVANTDFPAGTTFRMVGADGSTPIVGSVGPLAVGATTKVTLQATLPTDVTPTGAADFNATVKTISDSSGASDTSIANFIGPILASAVDLENNVAGFEGDGADPTNTGGVPWITNATDPGQPTVFDMKVENLGPTADSYNLTLDQPLPAGWLVEFQLEDGTIVTNTGTIPKADFKLIKVVITPDPLAAPGDTLVDIKVTSAVSGQSDRIENQVTVNEIVDVSLVASQSTQASPGGVVEMVHTLTNEGNLAITEGSISESGLSNFSGAIYWDANGNGTVDSAEQIIDNFDDLTDGVASGTNGLAPGDSVSLIYRVQTPGSATPGLSEVGTITVDGSLNGVAAKTDITPENNAVEDLITIISGDVTLTKYQYVDTGCNGAAGTFTKQRQDVDPGQCIRYRIVADNTGTSDADTVTIRDVAPAYTAIETCGGACNPAIVPAGNTISITGNAIEGNHGTLLPGGTAELEFTVKVAQ